MIRIAICEDERPLLDQLTDWMKAILEKNLIAYNIESFRNGSALLAREEFDILLLDIAMEPLDGLEWQGGSAEEVMRAGWYSLRPISNTPSTRMMYRHFIIWSSL